MNTLNRRYTATFFNNPSDYDTLVKRWSYIVNSDEGKNLTSTDFLYYMVLRGKDYKKAFFPGRKLQDYDHPEGLYNARGRLQYNNVFDKHFADILDKKWKMKVRKLIPGTGTKPSIYESDSYIDFEVEKLLEVAEITTTPMVQKAVAVGIKKNIFQKLFTRDA